jgi:hypothetical protein
MHWTDHAPPHFHAVYGNQDAVIEIKTLRTLTGTIPRRALALTLEWAALHREELLEAWELCRTHQTPKRIPPLD